MRRSSLQPTRAREDLMRVKPVAQKNAGCRSIAFIGAAGDEVGADRRRRRPWQMPCASGIVARVESGMHDAAPCTGERRASFPANEAALPTGRAGIATFRWMPFM